jgi:hypothetical protein
MIIAVMKASMELPIEFQAIQGHAGCIIEFRAEKSFTLFVTWAKGSPWDWGFTISNSW